VTKALVPETEAPGFEAKTEAIASETEAKTEAVDPKTKAKAARQLIGIGYSIPINIKYRYNVPKRSRYLMVSTNMTQFM